MRPRGPASAAVRAGIAYATAGPRPPSEPYEPPVAVPVPVPVPVSRRRSVAAATGDGVVVAGACSPFWPSSPGLMLGGSLLRAAVPLPGSWLATGVGAAGWSVAVAGG